MAEGKGFPLRVILTAVDRATAPLAAFNTRIKAFQQPFKRVNNALRELGEAAGIAQVGEAFSHLKERVHGVGEAVESLGRRLAIIGGIGGLGFAEILKSTAEAGSAIVKSAQKAGISRSAWQEYAFAAKQADVSTDSLATAFKKLQVNSIAARSGGREAQLWFRRAGVSLKDLRRLKPDDLLEKMSERFKALGPGAKSTALSVALLGRSGSDLLPMLFQGSKGIREQREELRRLGEMTDGEAEAADKFQENMKGVQTSLLSVKYAIGNALIPDFDRLLTRFKDFATTHKPEIVQGFRDIYRAIKPIGKGLLGIVEAVGPVNVALGGLALLTIPPVVKVVTSFVGALGSIGAVCLRLAPLLVPVAGPLAAIAASLAAIAAVAWVTHNVIGSVSPGYNPRAGQYGDKRSVWGPFNPRAGIYPVLPKMPVPLTSPELGILKTPALLRSSQAGPLGAPPLGATSLLARIKGEPGEGGKAGEGGRPGRDGRMTLEVSFKDVPRGTRIKAKAPDWINTTLNVGYLMPEASR